MKNEELVLKLIEKLIGEESPSVSSQKTGYEKYLGENVFIRSVTHHYTGTVALVDSLTLTLDDAAWIADDGRFHEFLSDTSKAEEVEPYKYPVSVGLGGILDITIVDSLPRGAK